MATSGFFHTNYAGRNGHPFYDRMLFEWWRTSWGRSGSVGYHNISYRLKTDGGSPSYYVYFYNGSMNVDGAGYSWGTTKAYGGGATVFGDYSKTLYTDNAGNRSFGASAQGGIETFAINTSGSGGWAMDNIPMYGDITAISNTSGLSDETANVAVTWYKYTGRATIWFRLDQINNSDTTYRYTNVGPNPLVWSGFATWVRTTMVNTNSTTLYIYYGDDLDSNGSVDRYDTPNTYTITIKNNTGQANPTFTTFDHIDTNAATVAVTGDNEVIIQGKSLLRATVPVANKATPNKNANMSSYLFTIGGYSSTSTWSNTVDVVKNINAVSDVTGSQNLSVKATDSRGNNKTVTKSITVIPYSSPAMLSTLNVRYTNDFDTASGITLVSNGTLIANVSPLTLLGVDKNVVSPTVGVRFDLSKGNNSSYTGVWVNVANTQAASTGNITTTIATIETDLLTKMNGLTADNTVKWYVKFEITDSLETTTREMVIDVGKPIFRIGTDGKVYNNEERIPTISQMQVLSVVYDNGTSTRSSTTSTSYVSVPGATGDTSYTAPCDVRILFTSTWMIDQTAGVAQINLSIDGVVQNPGTYTDFAATAGGWDTVSIQNVVDVDEGVTITIGAQWKTSAGTITICNDNSGDEPYSKNITGIVFARN